MGGGRGALSLLGLLVGVGLTFWLGSMAFGSGGSTATKVLPTSPGKQADAGPPNGKAIQVSPTTGLGNEPRVLVTSTAFPAKAEVLISTCLHGGQSVGATGCDPKSVVTLRVGTTGRLSSDYPVPRVISVKGIPFDCATRAKQCRVQVTSSANTGLGGHTDISFQADLGAPPLDTSLGD